MTPTSTAQVSFTPSQLTPNGATATTTLIIQAATAARSGHAVNDGQSLALLLFAPYGVAGLLLIGRRNKCRQQTAHSILRIIFFVSIALTLFGCGNNKSSSSPQTYQVQITATGAASGNNAAVTAATTVAFSMQ
jgi:hypothetical protein